MLARNKMAAFLYWKSFPFAEIRVIRGHFRRLGGQIQYGLSTPWRAWRAKFPLYSCNWPEAWSFLRSEIF